MNEIIHVSGLCRYCKKTGLTIIPAQGKIPVWLLEYYLQTDIYDRYIFDNFNSWFVHIEYLENENPYEILRNNLLTFTMMFDWKYQKIYDAMLLKYEPIENYRRTEKTTDTYTQNLTNENTKISSISNIVSGENNITETGTSNATIGANSTTTTNSYGNDTTTKSVVPYDTTNSYDSDITERVKNDDTGKIENSARNDTGNTTSNSVENISEERTISDNSKDTNTQTGNSVTEHETLVFGNIGVTTSQQMLEEEFKVANRSFLHDFFMDMITTIFSDFDW